MIRTQIYLTEKEKKAVEKLSTERNTTQSNIIREAIDEYVINKKSQTQKKSIMDFAGIWKDRKDTPDTDKLRDEWEERLDQLYNDH